MAKIDLDSMSIEEVADLRDLATDKLAEKVAARRAELEAELEKLAQYDKPAQVASRGSRGQAQKEPGERCGQHARRGRQKGRRGQGAGRQGCVTRRPDKAA